jgi:glycosyltransferase involved in cell wall biosynthesis
LRHNVLIIVAGDNGTIGRCSLNLYRAFKEREDVKVKCVGIHRLKGGLDGFGDCEFFSDRSKHENSIRSQVKWLKEIKSTFKPDLTISTLYSTNFLNVICGGSDFTVGIFHSPHKQGKSLGFVRYCLLLLLYWFVFPKLDYCSCVSKEVEEDLLHFKTIRKSRINTVYNIHQVDEIIERARDIGTEVIPPRPFFVYCGRMDPNKAPIRVIKALTLSKNKEILVIVGKGEESYVEDLKSQIDVLGLSEQVLFLGEKRNPYPYIKNAKALVSCSYSEGLPGVIIEALALGVPIVSTNSSMGIWEILSVEGSYNRSLDDIFVTEFGVITSNASVKDARKEELDVENLAKGLDRIDSFHEIPESGFLAKVDGATITSHYLSLIQ